MSGLGRDGEFQYLIFGPFGVQPVNFSEQLFWFAELVPEESAYEVLIAQGRAQKRDAVCVDEHLTVKFRRYEVKQFAVDKDVGFSGHRAKY